MFFGIGKVLSLFAAARLTNDKLAILGELVVGDLEVQRGRSFPDTARDIVVRTVARAEPATEVTGLADGNATQMGADACFCSNTNCQSPHNVVAYPKSEHPNALSFASFGKGDMEDVPSMTSHSGFLTRSASAWGSRRLETLTWLASSISAAVR